MKKQFNQQNFTYDQILEEWQQLQSASIKTKLKGVSTLATHIRNISDLENLTPDEFKNVLSILQQCQKLAFGYKNFATIIALIKEAHLKALGIAQPSIIEKKVKNLITEIAGFMVKDLSTEVELGDLSTATLCEILNQGKAFFIQTGSDGMYKISFILVEGQEPFTADILHTAYSCTEVANIECSSGELSIFANVYDEAKCTLKVPPGNYKIAGYAKLSSDESGLDIQIVISRTNEKPLNNFRDLPNLQ